MVKKWGSKEFSPENPRSKIPSKRAIISSNIDFSDKKMKTGRTMWCFGIVNSRLAEIFFDKKNGKVGIWGHCYVKKEEYKTKQERKWIEEDTKNVKVVYRNKKYKLIINPEKRS